MKPKKLAASLLFVTTSFIFFSCSTEKIALKEAGRFRIAQSSPGVEPVYQNPAERVSSNVEREPSANTLTAAIGSELPVYVPVTPQEKNVVKSGFFMKRQGEVPSVEEKRKPANVTEKDPKEKNKVGDNAVLYLLVGYCLGLLSALFFLFLLFLLSW